MTQAIKNTSTLSRSENVAKSINIDSLDIGWDKIRRDEFWATADYIQDVTLEHARKLFAFVAEADPETLRSILIQYRYFTVYYIPDLSLLITRMSSGKMRSFLGDILNDELGSGNPAHAHPQLYDDFLRSIGVKDEDLDILGLDKNINLLDHARQELVNPNNSIEFGIGLRGMGGECVCQVYISQLYDYLVQNPYIKSIDSNIDWRFWDLHVGEHDIEHRIATRKLIDSEIVKNDEKPISELGRGYGESMTSWRQFWQNIFDAAKEDQVKVPRKIVNNWIDVKLA